MTSFLASCRGSGFDVAASRWPDVAHRFFASSFLASFLLLVSLQFRPLAVSTSIGHSLLSSRRGCLRKERCLRAHVPQHAVVFERVSERMKYEVTASALSTMKSEQRSSIL